MCIVHYEDGTGSAKAIARISGHEDYEFVTVQATPTSRQRCGPRDEAKQDRMRCCAARAQALDFVTMNAEEVERSISLLQAHRAIEQKIYRMGYTLEDGELQHWWAICFATPHWAPT